MTIGKRIKEVREGRGMSMSDLAKVLDITPSGVSNWENERFNPRPAMLSRVADALHVDRSYLETGETQQGKKGEMPAVDVVSDTQDVSDVLAEAKAEIAAILKLSVDKIEVSLKVTV